MCGGMCFGYTLKVMRKTKEWKEEEEDSNHIGQNSPPPSMKKIILIETLIDKNGMSKKKLKNLKKKVDKYLGIILTNYKNFFHSRGLLLSF